jgi:hypothetical protein
MKLFFAVLMLSVQVLAAETSSITRIEDPEKKAQYIEAAMTALRGKKFNCVDIKGKPFDGGRGENVNLGAYDELTVNRAGQPLLVFSDSRNEGATVLSFTSSADFKSLVSVIHRVYENQRVNTGTLLDPNYQIQRVLKTQSSCSIE